MCQKCADSVKKLESLGASREAIDGFLWGATPYPFGDPGTYFDELIKTIDVGKPANEAIGQSLAKAEEENDYAMRHPSPAK